MLRLAALARFANRQFPLQVWKLLICDPARSYFLRGVGSSPCRGEGEGDSAKGRGVLWVPRSTAAPRGVAGKIIVILDFVPRRVETNRQAA